MTARAAAVVTAFGGPNGNQSRTHGFGSVLGISFLILIAIIVVVGFVRGRR